MIIPSLLGLAVALPLLVLSNDDEIGIDPVGVPAELAARGYTTEVVTRRLRDELRTIVLESGGTHEGVPVGIVSSSVVEQVAELLHVAEPVGEIKIMLGETRHELDAEIVQSGDRLLFDVDLFELPAGPMSHLAHQVDVNDVDASIELVARWTMSHLDAFTLLKYEFAQARLSGDFTSVVAALGVTRRSAPATLLPAIDNLEGMVRLARGDAAAAEGFFRQALRRDPRFVDAELNLAAAVAVRGDGDAADALLAELAEDERLGWWPRDSPTRAAALALRGLIADSRGAEAAALACLHEAIAAAPDLAEAHAFLAVVLRGRGLGPLALHHERRVDALRADVPARLPGAYLDAAVLRRLLPGYVGATDPDPDPDMGPRVAAAVGRS